MIAAAGRPPRTIYLRSPSALEFCCTDRIRLVARRGKQTRPNRELTGRPGGKKSWRGELEPQHHRPRRTDGLQALQEEVDTLLRKTILCHGKEWTDSDEPLYGLWSRLSQYQSVCDQIVAQTSRTPVCSRTSAFHPLQPNLKAMFAEVAGLPAQLQNAWFAALPVDRFQRARGIVSEVSNSVRRQLG